MLREARPFGVAAGNKIFNITMKSFKEETLREYGAYCMLY